MLFVALFGHLPGLVMTLRRGGRGISRSLGKKTGRGERETNEEKAEKLFHGYKKKDTVWTKKFNLF
jgi:ribosomal protein L15